MDKDNTGTQKIEFVRSSFTYDGHGYRNQMNKITAWVDGSNVYGSDEEKALKLRTMSGGKLK